MKGRVRGQMRIKRFRARTICQYSLGVSSNMFGLTRFMIPIRAVAFAIVLCVLSGGASAAEDIQKAAEGMLNRARQLSDIRSPNAPGFRMKLTFSFVGHDLETLQGSYTEVWVSNSQWRRETAVGDFQRIEIGGPSKRWLVDSGKDFFEEAARVPTMIEVFPTTTAKFEFESFANPDSATRCAVTRARGTLHTKWAFCFDKNSQLLVENITPQWVGQQIGDYSCNYSQFQKFGDYSFPHNIVCFQDGHRKLSAKVEELSPVQSPDAALFMPPAGAVETGTCSEDLVMPRGITTPHPAIPLGIQDQRISVVLSMVVDIKGNPQDLKIARSGGKQFDDAVMATVRGWRFWPATCGGKPMASAINIELQFLGHR
jgi:TonB family protein